MSTQTVRNLPPAFLSAIGELFSSYLTGQKDIKDSPFFVDPSTFTGKDFVAGEDPLTLRARDLASGLGGYQSFLDRSSEIAGIAENLVIDPATGQVRRAPGADALDRAGSFYDAAGRAAIAGQDAGMQDLTGARGTIDEMLAAARAGQGAGTADFEAARRLSGGQGFDEFMSPYQQEVIDATMAQLQEELGAQQAALGTSAGSAFGGGRFGVAQGQLAAQGALNKALTGAQLRAQGFSQAQQAASRAAAQRLGIGQAAMQQAGQNVALFQPTLAGQFQAGQQAMQQAGQNVGMLGQAGGFQAGISGLQNQQLQNQLSQLGGLAAQQQGLGEFGTRMLGNQINTLTQMGQQSQAYQQALLDAQRASLREQAFAGQQGLGFLGQMLGSAYGAPGMTTFTTTPDPSTFQTLFGAGTGILGILGAGGFFDRGEN